MSKHHLITTSLEGQVFRKSIKDNQDRYEHWVVTKERNGYFVWVGRCVDTKPWEESDWRWDVESIEPSYHKNEAIEKCLLSAIDAERKYQCKGVMY